MTAQARAKLRRLCLELADALGELEAEPASPAPPPKPIKPDAISKERLDRTLAKMGFVRTR